MISCARIIRKTDAQQWNLNNYSHLTLYVFVRFSTFFDRFCSSQLLFVSLQKLWFSFALGPPESNFRCSDSGSVGV